METKTTTYQGKKVQTIDCTPSWQAALRIYLGALENGNAEGRKAAMEGLQQMADVAQRHAELIKSNIIQDMEDTMLELITSAPANALLNPKYKEAESRAKELIKKLNANTVQNTNLKYALVKNRSVLNDKPGWCMLISTPEQVELIRKGTFHTRAYAMLHGEGAWSSPRTGIREFSKFEEQRTSNWEKHLSRGETILQWCKGTGYALLSTCCWDILEIMELPYPEMPGENKTADIVVCENDAQPEQWWIDNLRATFEGKSITTLTNFSLRSKESLIERFKAASIISFTTTFSNWNWFETLLDVMIENNLIGKRIYGNHVDAVTNYPDYILEKVNRVALNNEIVILNGKTPLIK